jgi:hypothetical protein
MAQKSVPRQNVLNPGEMDGVRPATTLDATVIRDAVVYGDRNAQRQIREYGRLRAKIFNELITHVELPTDK